MRIGVIGDTHIPDQSPVLSARIGSVFQDLDIILHVGDICELSVLEEFQETFTLTFAVFGERDSEPLRRLLDESRVVCFGDRRIGMIHGNQFEERQARRRGRMRGLFRKHPSSGSLPDFLLEWFADEDVHAIVFGHTHEPYIRMHNGVLHFNPGSAVPVLGQQPSVGILDVEGHSITGRIVQL